MRIEHAHEHAHARLPPTESAIFRFRGKLTWMLIKCYWAAPLHSPNSIGLNCPNSDSKTSHFRGGVRLLLPFNRCIFHNVSFWDKVPNASNDDCRNTCSSSLHFKEALFLKWITPFITKLSVEASCSLITSPPGKERRCLPCNKTFRWMLHRRPLFVIYFYYFTL